MEVLQFPTFVFGLNYMCICVREMSRRICSCLIYLLRICHNPVRYVKNTSAWCHDRVICLNALHGQTALTHPHHQAMSSVTTSDNLKDEANLIVTHQRLIANILLLSPCFQTTIPCW